MTTTVEFEIPEAVPSLNVWRKWHFQKYKRERDQLAWKVMAALGYKPKQPIEHCIVIVERHGSRDLDWVNLYGSFKLLEDVLVVPSKRNPSGIGLIFDDAPKYVKSLAVVPFKCAREDEKTKVTIMPVGEHP